MLRGLAHSGNIHYGLEARHKSGVISSGFSEGLKMIDLLAADCVSAEVHVACKEICMDNRGFGNVVAIISILKLKGRCRVLLLRFFFVRTGSRLSPLPFRRLCLCRSSWTKLLLGESFDIIWLECCLRVEEEGGECAWLFPWPHPPPNQGQRGKAVAHGSLVLVGGKSSDFKNIRLFFNCRSTILFCLIVQNFIIKGLRSLCVNSINLS